MILLGLWSLKTRKTELKTRKTEFKNEKNGVLLLCGVIVKNEKNGV